MTLDLDIKALSTITAALRVLERVWAERKEVASDEDEISDLTNDILFAQSLRTELERRMSERG